MTLRVEISVAMLAIVSTLAVGCAVGVASPTQLLVLTPLTDTAPREEPSAVTLPLLIVGPVALPAYTDRTQFLVLKSAAEMQAAATARWAEPLDEGVSRVLVENLSRLLHTGRVATLGRAQAADSLQVTVEVTEFITTASGQAQLTAFWQVLGDDGRTVLAQDKTQFTAAMADTDYPAQATALSEALAALSRAIADAVREIVNTARPSGAP